MFLVVRGSKAQSGFIFVRVHSTQVLDIGRGIETPITGMHLYKIPATDKYFIVVTTANKLYQFKGTVTDDKPVLQQIFKTYLNIPEKFETDLGGVVNNSKLDFYYSNVKEGPKRFAWLTGNKLYYGQHGWGRFRRQKFMEAVERRWSYYQEGEEVVKRARI